MRFLSLRVPIHSRAAGGGACEEDVAVLSDPAIYEFENAPPETEEWLANRYERLQMRGPDAGKETWLNWIVRLPDGACAGHLQATILPEFEAYIAYELASRYWRKGTGGGAVNVMLEELRTHYQVREYIAVFKARISAQKHYSGSSV